MRSNYTGLYSSDSPWKDGVEPVFQTGTFLIQQNPQQTMMGMNRYPGNPSYSYQMQQAYHPNSQLQGSQASQNQQQKKDKKQKKDEKNPSNLKEQFQHIFQQDQENVKGLNNPSNKFSNIDVHNDMTEFQGEASKIIQNIQNNLQGIVTGIQKNIIKSVNSNVNHQLKKQRYMVNKKHEEVIYLMKQQERINETKFSNTTPRPAHQPYEKQKIEGGDSPYKKQVNEDKKKHNQENQLKEKDQLQLNKGDVLNFANLQKVKEYDGDTDRNKDQPSSNRNQIKSDNSFRQPANINYKNRDEDGFPFLKRDSSDNSKINQTLKAGSNIGEKRNSISSVASQQNNKQTISKKYDQLFEETNQQDISKQQNYGQQQSDFKNESKLIDNGSLEYTLDDEISKASVFFGNRDSFAFDQSRLKVPLSKNNSQLNQQKPRFNDVEEVDLDDIDNLDWSSKNKTNVLTKSTKNTAVPTQQSLYQSKLTEKTTKSDKYDDEFEDLLDEDEFENVSYKKGGVSSVAAKSNITKSNNKDSEDEIYKYDQDFDDDF